MLILPNSSLPTPDIIRNLGMRFRDCRMRLNMNRKDVSEFSGIGMTTIYNFETGRMTDMSFSTLMRLLRAVGMRENWEKLIPELPESPYLYDDKGTKKQRIRHKKPSTT